MTLHCSKNVKNFKNSNLDVIDILRWLELKLGFIIFQTIDVNALRQLNNIWQLSLLWRACSKKEEKQR